MQGNLDALLREDVLHGILREVGAVVFLREVGEENVARPPLEMRDGQAASAFARWPWFPRMRRFSGHG